MISDVHNASCLAELLRGYFLAETHLLASARLNIGVQGALLNLVIFDY